MTLSWWPFRMSPDSQGLKSISVHWVLQLWFALLLFFQVEGTVVERGPWTGSLFFGRAGNHEEDHAGTHNHVCQATDAAEKLTDGGLSSLSCWMRNWRNPSKTAKLQNPAKASFWTWMSDFLMVLKTWGSKVRNSSKMMITRSHAATVFQHIFSVCFRLLHHKSSASASTCQKPGKIQRMWLQYASVAQWHPMTLVASFSWGSSSHSQRYYIHLFFSNIQVPQFCHTSWLKREGKKW